MVLKNLGNLGYKEILSSPDDDNNLWSTFSFLINMIFFLVLLLYVLFIKQLPKHETRTQDIGSQPWQNLSLLERKTLLQISLIEASINKCQTLDPWQEDPQSTSQAFFFCNTLSSFRHFVLPLCSSSFHFLSLMSWNLVELLLCRALAINHFPP